MLSERNKGNEDQSVAISLARHRGAEQEISSLERPLSKSTLGSAPQSASRDVPSAPLCLVSEIAALQIGECKITNFVLADLKTLLGVNLSNLSHAFAEKVLAGNLQGSSTALTDY